MPVNTRRISKGFAARALHPPGLSLEEVLYERHDAPFTSDSLSCEREAVRVPFERNNGKNSNNDKKNNSNNEKNEKKNNLWASFSDEKEASYRIRYISSHSTLNEAFSLFFPPHSVAAHRVGFESALATGPQSVLFSTLSLNPAKGLLGEPRQGISQYPRLPLRSVSAQCLRRLLTQGQSFVYQTLKILRPPLYFQAPPILRVKRKNLMRIHCAEEQIYSTT